MSHLRVIFLGGKQAGLVGLLATLSMGCNVKAIVSNDSVVIKPAIKLKIPVYQSVKQIEIVKLLPTVDLLISVHSREIIPEHLLGIPRLGGINVHPCLSSYKGKEPIKRFLAGELTQASVGIHWMVKEVDMGKTIKELYIDIDREVITHESEIYNLLYPLYSLVLMEVLEMLNA